MHRLTAAFVTGFALFIGLDEAFAQLPPMPSRDEIEKRIEEEMDKLPSRRAENAYVTIKIRRQLAYFVYRQTERLEEAEELLRESPSGSGCR